METREQILQRLKAQIKVSGRCIGVAAGSGLTARCAEHGGADFILALSAGRYRQIGLGSSASFLCYANSNEMVMGFGTRELLNAVSRIPVLFGLNASDPTIDLYDYLKEIRYCGFAGINNYPTVSILDGQFRRCLEEEGASFEREVEAIRVARFLNLLTVAYVNEPAQAEAMIDAGADVICLNFGFTTGGQRGARKPLTIENARMKMDEVFEVCERKQPGIIKMVYGGPISKSEDMRRFYENPLCNGYIGGSAFERIPIEKAITDTVRSFRSADNQEETSMIRAGTNAFDDVGFIRYYIEHHYQEPVSLDRIAELTHRSYSYLSSKFSRTMGCTFTEYLINYRIDRAIELMEITDLPLTEIADRVGYRDYTQFSKTFRKYRGMPPKEYRNGFR